MYVFNFKTPKQHHCF